MSAGRDRPLKHGLLARNISKQPLNINSLLFYAFKVWYTSFFVKGHNRIITAGPYLSSVNSSFLSTVVMFFLRKEIGTR